jgi:hypothetical protein
MPEIVQQLSKLLLVSGGRALTSSMTSSSVTFAITCYLSFGGSLLDAFLKER